MKISCQMKTEILCLKGLARSIKSLKFQQEIKETPNSFKLLNQTKQLEQNLSQNREELLDIQLISVEFRLDS